MAYKKVRITFWLGLAALTIASLSGCKEKPQNGEQTAENRGPSVAQGATQGEQKTASEPTTASDSKLTLREIIARRRGWKPVFSEWYGKEAPDFNVTDINDKQHTLSEYKGRNVMLVFWATWCGPCIQEIPHLIELRKEVGDDKLAMLAVSLIGFQNSTEKVKRFVAANPVINYTVISTDIAKMPAPYNGINGIPCTFYIDPDGKIKIVTEGLISLPQIRAILEAER